MVGGGGVQSAWPSSPSVSKLYVEDDGHFPNNSNFPVLKYSPLLFELHSSSSSPTQSSLTKMCEKILRENGWTMPWAGIVYDYHHYHSSSWECLCCVAGEATVVFGGPTGVSVDVKCGDVVLIPPGVAHFGKNSTDDFTVLGTYPEGFDVDLLVNPPTKEQRQTAASLPLPETDPIYGKNPPWKSFKNLL